MYIEEILEATPLFRGLSDAVEWAVRYGEDRTFGKGDVVFSPASFTPALGVVLEGSLEVTRGAMRMDALKPGDLFGAAALFERRGRYPTTLTAREQSRVLLLSRKLMEELMTRFPALALRYIDYLSDRLTFLSDRLDALGAGPAAEKLLCFLRDRGGAVSGLSGDRLAATLRMSRATLYRAIDALEGRGLLVRKGMNLTLTQTQKEEH